MKRETDMMEGTAGASASKEGKYLTFTLGKEEYGIGILKIQTSLIISKNSPFFLTLIILMGSHPLQPRATYRLASAPPSQLIFDKAVPGPPVG